MPSSAETTSSTIISKNFKTVAPFSLNLSMDEVAGLKLFNNTPLLHDIMSLAHDQLPLKALNSEISNLEYVKSMRQLNTISSHTGLTLSIVTLIILILVVRVMASFARATQEQEQVIDNNAPVAVGRLL